MKNPIYTKEELTPEVVAEMLRPKDPVSEFLNRARKSGKGTTYIVARANKSDSKVTGAARMYEGHDYEAAKDAFMEALKDTGLPNDKLGFKIQPLKNGEIFHVHPDREIEYGIIAFTYGKIRR